MAVANGEDGVTDIMCSVALGKLTLSKSKSMIVSNLKGLAKRVQRILKVNDLHPPVADAARDLGIDAAGGVSRRRKARNQRLRAGRRWGKKR